MLLFSGKCVNIMSASLYAGVENENDFNWLAQLRYYWENNTVMVRITNSLVKYAYEYLGNSFR